MLSSPAAPGTHSRSKDKHGSVQHGLGVQLHRPAPRSYRARCKLGKYRRPRRELPGRQRGAGYPPAESPAEPVAAAVYVHWPYCRQLCTYCSFNKYAARAVDEAAVRACLVREARTLLRLGRVRSVTSVFFGGGTPSLASAGTVAAVLEAIAGAALLPARAEVTLEANPSSAGAARLAAFKAAGVNRLSLGVQSLDDAELRLLGRDHTAAEAAAALAAARRLFPGRTSLDLLFGLPGQSAARWARALAAALPLCDDHVALYELTLEAGTPLRERVRRGLLPAPRPCRRAMFDAACAAMARAGFRHYEVSNFARKGAVSTHNLSYWRARPYVGVGPGAHGRFVPWAEGATQREARTQTPEPEAWMREVRAAGHGTRRRLRLGPLQLLEEVLVLGLRMDTGITHQHWREFSPHLSLWDVFGAPGEASELEEQGWLLLDGSGLRCSWEGLAVLDSLLPALLCQLQRRWVPGAAPPAPR
ncbi:radical S-adenosyl methionine domain-containing protein 1, mitochondrial [Eudromia elegans]